MSDEETEVIHPEEGQMLTAEYKDGQLQIVEVSAFDKGRYIQVMDSDRGVMNLDLLSLLKSDGSSTFQLMETDGTDDGEGENTITCVLANQGTEPEEADGDQSYVIVEEGRKPVVYMHSAQDDTKKNKPLTPDEILEKAKAIQKANLLRVHPSRTVGRKRKQELPPSAEMLSLLSAPGFKLYLYNCKLCSFKCNAIKDMSKHKRTEHRGRSRGGAGRSAGATLQCARCPYRATTHSQLLKHGRDVHSPRQQDSSIHCKVGDVVLNTDEVVLNSDEVLAADVLVCGACGFESGHRGTFKRHIQDDHGVNVALSSHRLSFED